MFPLDKYRVQGTVLPLACSTCHRADSADPIELGLINHSHVPKTRFVACSDRRLPRRRGLQLAGISTGLPPGQRGIDDESKRRAG